MPMATSAGVLPAEKRQGKERNYEMGGVIEGSDCQHTLDALLQPGQPQDGGKPALDRAQLFYVTISPMFRVLAL